MIRNTSLEQVESVFGRIPFPSALQLTIARRLEPFPYSAPILSMSGKMLLLVRDGEAGDFFCLAYNDISGFFKQPSILTA